MTALIAVRSIHQYGDGRQESGESSQKSEVRRQKSEVKRWSRRRITSIYTRFMCALFEINLEAANRASLKVSSRLLRVADVVRRGRRQ